MDKKQPKKILPKPADPELLSVIVPVYKCKTIDRDLLAIATHLEELNRPYELLCIVDGKCQAEDNTEEIARHVEGGKIKVYAYEQNKGKGYAIRFGMARSKGGVIAFIDAGSDLNAKGLGMALEHMKWYEADIIIGSKRHKASKVNYPWQRRILSFFVQRATRYIFGINVSDTQTGLKIFKRNVLEKVLPRLLVKRWAFDLEVLTVANHLGFKKIYESPVEIKYNFTSTINNQAVINFFIDYLAIIYRIYIRRYYDDKKHDLWKGDPQLALRYHL